VLFPPPGRAALLLLAAVVAPAPPASAGLHLTWNDCAQGSGASPNLDFACSSSSGQSALFCAFTLAQPVDSVLGVEIVVDLQHGSPVLPDWWRFEAGGCREKLLRADDGLGDTDCLNPWTGGAAGGVATLEQGMPRGAPNQLRIKVTLGVPSSEPRSLEASTMYNAARILISHGSTSSCGGCAEGACLVLNSILIRRPPRPEGAPSTDVRLEEPGAGTLNWATWQGGGGAACESVPTRAATWGAIKRLYR